MSKVKFFVLFLFCLIFLSCGNNLETVKAEITKLDTTISKLKNDIKLLESRLKEAKGDAKVDIQKKIKEFEIRMGEKIQKKESLKKKFKKLIREA